jgi:hypothetical protein
MPLPLIAMDREILFRNGSMLGVMLGRRLTIRDDADYVRPKDDIHFNPVKHGLVDHPADRPFSTFHRCVSHGLYPPGWTNSAPLPQETGERPDS